MKLTIRKYDPSDSSRCSFDEARSLYSSTTYDIRVFAADFVSDRTSTCTLRLLRKANPEDVAMTEYAVGTLVPDPYRRDCRYGTLAITDTAHALLFEGLSAKNSANVLDDFILCVTLGASMSRVLYAQCPVVIAPIVVQGAGDASKQIDSSSYLWTKVNLGALSPESDTVTDARGVAFAVPLRDRSMTKCEVDLSSLTGSKDFIVVPVGSDGLPFAGEVFEASLVVQIRDAEGCENEGSWQSSGSVGLPGRRLLDILRGTALPPRAGVVSTSEFAWDYDDARGMASSTDRFLIKVVRYPHDGQWHAEFRVANAAAVGVEIDPDEGAAIPGAGINV